MLARRIRLRRAAEPEVRETFELTGSLDEIRERFGVVRVEADYESRDRLEPTDPVPIVVGRRRERKLVDARWGLFPFWAKDAVHADLHRLPVKPTFDRLIRRQRCVVPGTALVTFAADGRFLRIVRLMPREGGVFGMAGLYEEFVSASGRLHRAFTIVTAGRRGLPGAERNCMPLLLGEDEADRWLDPGWNADGVPPVSFRLPDDETWIAQTLVRRLEHEAPD
mgnify:CR=1 FL=1|jgi:putative SOS response-associated peptidase YedK